MNTARHHPWHCDCSGSRVAERARRDACAGNAVLRNGLPMLDREKVVTVLRRRFPGSATDQVAAAANAILGLDDEWEELTAADVSPCCDACCLAEDSLRSGQFKVLKKRTTD
jgi:hypothetical protein